MIIKLIKTHANNEAASARIEQLWDAELKLRTSLN